MTTLFNVMTPKQSQTLQFDQLTEMNQHGGRDTRVAQIQCL